MRNDELYHFGIKGMKWGQRRYQNKDGSLTPEGKKRYSEDYAETSTLRKKDPRTLSNDELRKVSERIELEQRYARLNTRTVKTGEKIVKEVTTNVAKQQLTNLANSSIKAGYKKLNNILKEY